MAAPPGSPYAWWAIGTGGTFNNGAEVSSWTDQQLGIVLSDTAGGGNSYSSSSHLIVQTTGGMYNGAGLITMAQPWAIAGMWGAVPTDFTWTLWNGLAFIQVAPNSSGWIQGTSDNSNFQSWLNTTAITPSSTWTYLMVFNGTSSKCYVNGSPSAPNGGTTTGTAGWSGSPIEFNGTGGGSNILSASMGSQILYANDPSANAAAIDTWLRAQGVPPVVGGGTFDTATFDTATFDTKNFHY